MQNLQQNLHKIGVKVFADRLPEDLLGFIPVFHRWIQQDALSDLLIDVADYTHVHHGPGVMLIAHEGNYALDEAGGRRGLLYTSKHELPGELHQRLALVLKKTLLACRLLEQSPECQDQVEFRGDRLEIFANDRLAAPQDEDGYRILEPAVKDVLDTLYGTEYTLERQADPRERAGFLVQARQALSVEALLNRLS